MKTKIIPAVYRSSTYYNCVTHCQQSFDRLQTFLVYFIGSKIIYSAINE